MITLLLLGGEGGVMFSILCYEIKNMNKELSAIFVRVSFQKHTKMYVKNLNSHLSLIKPRRGAIKA